MGLSGLLIGLRLRGRPLPILTTFRTVYSDVVGASGRCSDASVCCVLQNLGRVS